VQRLHAPNEFFSVRGLRDGMRAWEELRRLTARTGPRAGKATTAEATSLSKELHVTLSGNG
jgi:hypothetical protein